MGLKLIANDVLSPWHTKVVPPVTRGLEGWFTFDSDASRFSFNRAIGKSDAAVVGAPVAYATHGRFKGLTSYLQTAIEETDEQTLIVVGKSVVAPTGAADGAFYVGNYQGNSKSPGYTGAAFGTSIFHSASTAVTGGSSRDNGSGGISSAQVLLTGTPTTWAIRAVRTKSGVPTDVYNLTAGTKASSSSALARVIADTKHRIGSATGSFSGEVDISSVAIFSKYLAEDELFQLASVMRKRMARLGISV